jgi:hypothetical protein
MAASMAARWHRPATAAPNRGQAGASNAPQPERTARSTSTSGESRSMEIDVQTLGTVGLAREQERRGASNRRRQIDAPSSSSSNATYGELQDRRI